VPPGAFALIHGTGAEVGDTLARHPGLAMISFTGSTRAGTSVTKAAADTVKRVSRWSWAENPPTSSSPIAAMRWRIAFAPPWPNVSSTPASPATRPHG
jgi:hypothetical protein